jgi:hypothetical protein
LNYPSIFWKSFCLFLLFFTTQSFSSETDQFLALGKTLQDSTPILNKILNHNLKLVIKKGNRKKSSCYQLTTLFAKEMTYGDQNLMDLSIRQNRHIDQMPSSLSNRESFYEQSIYNGLKKFDFGKGDNRFLSPTLEINGIRLGGDKVSHITYIGFSYYKMFYSFFKFYKKKFPRGLAQKKALEKAINFGIFQEKTITGSLVAGVFSFADLEANYQGLRLFHHICGSHSPYVIKINDQWMVQKNIDIRTYATPDLDESVYPNVYKARMWKKVKRNMKKYCSPQFLNNLKERSHYYEHFPKSLSSLYLKKKINSGTLSNPSFYTLKRVCQSKYK